MSAVTDALRTLFPEGTLPELDTALAEADDLHARSRVLLAEFDAAVLDAAASSPGGIAAALVDGTLSPTEAVARAAAPGLTDAAEDALVNAVRTKVRAALTEADAVALDQLGATWQTDALAAPQAAWTEAADTLDRALVRHGVEPDPMAVLAAPAVVGTAWRAAGLAGRAALHAAALVGQLDEVPGSPLDPRSTTAWWSPDPVRHDDTLARAVAARTWQPTEHPAELLPVRAREAGMLLGPVDHVQVLRRERAWEATAEARQALAAVTGTSVNYGQDVAGVLAALPHLQRVVDEARRLDDGLRHRSVGVDAAA